MTEAQSCELNLQPGQQIPELAGWIRELAAARAAFAERLAERRSVTIPHQDPGYRDLGHAFPSLVGLRRGAILQPPIPHITPSARVLELARQRDTEIEAGN